MMRRLFWIVVWAGAGAGCSSSSSGSDPPGPAAQCTSGCDLGQDAKDVYGDPKSCGPARAVCAAGPASYPLCANDVCSLGCDVGFGDCNRRGEDGCEVDLLSDAKNCGSCGRDCLGSLCLDGRCEPVILATGQDEVNRIVVADGTIYWTIIGNNVYETTAVTRMAVSGGEPEPIADKPGDTWGLAVDAANVYWTCNGGGVTGPWQRDLEQSSEPKLLSYGSAARGLAVNETAVFWAEQGEGEEAGTGSIRTIPKGGGDLPDDKKLVVGNLDRPLDVVADEANVYFTTANGVYRAAIATKTVTAVAEAQSSPSGLRLYEGKLYWANTGSGEIISAPREGGPVTVLAVDAREPVDLAVDESGVYWITRSGDVNALRPGSASLTRLAINQNSPVGIALDAQAVYFTAVGDHTVKKVAK